MNRPLSSSFDMQIPCIPNMNSFLKFFALFSTPLFRMEWFLLRYILIQLISKPFREELTHQGLRTLFSWALEYPPRLLQRWRRAAPGGAAGPRCPHGAARGRGRLHTAAPAAARRCRCIHWRPLAGL